MCHVKIKIELISTPKCKFLKPPIEVKECICTQLLSTFRSKNIMGLIDDGGRKEASWVLIEKRKKQQQQLHMIEWLVSEGGEQKRSIQPE
jgi:hypothetical protein